MFVRDIMRKKVEVINFEKSVLEAATTSVFDCMTSGIQYCFYDEDVKELARKMKRTQRHRIPVVNREKRLVGIVSSKDLATHAKDKELTQSTFERIYT